MLVGLTVAIAIVASLWMGALTLSYQRNEELAISNVVLQGNVATFYVSNKGTADITITRVQVSGLGVSSTANSFTPTGTNPVPKGSSTTLAITVSFTGGQTAFQTSSQYTFVLITSQGHLFPTTQVA